MEDEDPKKSYIDKTVERYVQYGPSRGPESGRPMSHIRALAAAMEMARRLGLVSTPRPNYNRKHHTEDSHMSLFSRLFENDEDSEARKVRDARDDAKWEAQHSSTGDAYKAGFPKDAVSPKNIEFTVRDLRASKKGGIERASNAAEHLPRKSHRHWSDYDSDMVGPTHGGRVPDASDWENAHKNQAWFRAALTKQLAAEKAKKDLAHARDVEPTSAEAKAQTDARKAEIAQRARRESRRKELEGTPGSLGVVAARKRPFEVFSKNRGSKVSPWFREKEPALDLKRRAPKTKLLGRKINKVSDEDAGYQEEAFDPNQPLERGTRTFGSFKAPAGKVVSPVVKKQAEVDAQPRKTPSGRIAVTGKDTTVFGKALPGKMSEDKLPKLGTGTRFAKLEKSLAAKGARTPGALAAFIGRKKFGKKRFAQLSSGGKRTYSEEVSKLFELSKNLVEIRNTLVSE